MTDRMDKIKESGLNDGWEDDYVSPDPISSRVATLIVRKVITANNPDNEYLLKGDPGYETYAIDQYTIGVRPKWISVEKEMPPKDGKFLFSCFSGIGLGNWGQCYTVRNGNSERTHEAYILILWPSEILDGSSPWELSEDHMIEMEMKWMPLPNPPVINES